MTPRKLCHVALAMALAVQVAMVLTYGAITEWCFCSVTGASTPPTPPPFVLRFLDLAVLPAAAMEKGLAPPVLIWRNLFAWFFAALGLLYGMTLAARIRIRPAGGADGRRIWLAGAESVRLWQMLSIGCVLIGLGMAGGAMARQRWLAEAERVFAATMAAASTGRPFPAEVENFSMYEIRGDDFVHVTPEARYLVEVDPAESGDHFLDRFVAPYKYGGSVRFPSGKRFDFGVYHQRDRWSVYLDQWPRRRGR
ncbi:MAG TPA: hypothetical protein VEQ60_24445 [Longimicrobium sp.]|nr:hypothetical protein [Longimicrobium sp.]